MKILDKYIELIEEGYCSDCNELNCIDNFPQEKIVQEIKKIQQESQQLKKQKDDVVDWLNNNYCYVGKKMTLKPYSDLNDILRILGEIDVS